MMKSLTKTWLYWILVILAILAVFIYIGTRDVIVVSVVTVSFSILATILLVSIIVMSFAYISRCPFCGKSGLKMIPVIKNAGTCKHCGKTVEWKK